MPFWNYFWLIVPAVTLLTLAVLYYVRTGRAESDEKGQRR